MENFKGSKGKWKSYFNGHYYEIKTSVDDFAQTLASTQKNKYLNISAKTEQANALLISKAPEMLGLLEDFVDTASGVGVLNVEYYKNKFEQLIKSATEL